MARFREITWVIGTCRIEARRAVFNVGMARIGKDKPIDTPQLDNAQVLLRKLGVTAKAQW